MSGVIQVFDRKVGAGDIAFGNASFSYVDENGTSRRQSQVNALCVPVGSGQSVQTALASGLAYTDARYASSEIYADASVLSSAALYQLTSEKDKANGYVGLNASTQVALTELAASPAAGKWLEGNQTWSIPPKLTGDVVQTIYTERTDFYQTSAVTIPSDDSLPQITEGHEILSAVITPTASGNTLIVDGLVNVTVQVQQNCAALFLDANADAIKAKGAQPPYGTYPHDYRIKHRMTANTTGSTLFTIRFGGNTTSVIYLNGNSGGHLYSLIVASYIQITELKA